MVKNNKKIDNNEQFSLSLSLQGRKVLPRPLKDGLRAPLPFLLGSASLSPSPASYCRLTSPSSSSPCSSLLHQLLQLSGHHHPCQSALLFRIIYLSLLILRTISDRDVNKFPLHGYFDCNMLSHGRGTPSLPCQGTTLSPERGDSAPCTQLFGILFGWVEE